MGSRRCSVWLPTAEGGLVCRATEGDAEYATLQGRALAPVVVARCSGRSEPSSSRCARRCCSAAPSTRGSSRRRTPSRSSPSTRGSRRSRSRPSRTSTGASSSCSRDREPGAPGDHERRELRHPRADVPLDRRGARERARGEGLLHVLAHALDLRHGDRGRPGARSRRGAAQAPRARRALPRHRQDRHPGLDPHRSPAR